MLETAYETVSTTLLGIFSVDLFTLMVVGLLATVAGMLIKSMIDSTAIALTFTPVIYFGALASVYGCKLNGIVFAFQKEANMIFSASTGMMVSLLLMLVALRLVYAVSIRRKTGLEARMTKTTRTLPPL